MNNTLNGRSLPSVANEGGLGRYLDAIKRFPLLDPQEEYMLARAYRDHDDRDAAQRLVTSHLRLVAKIAMGYRHYGLPIADLVSEGTLGLMRAVKKFDPEKGFRLATYAMWWIKAALNEFVLNSWSMVKMGTVAAQKKLFFNLRRLKAQLGAYGEAELSPEHASSIAETLQVSPQEVLDMNRRMMRPDASLNAPVAEGRTEERMTTLVDEGPNPEELVSDRQERVWGRGLLRDALENLNQREREIIQERRLRDDPLTLEVLGERYGISRERVRQIENRAFEKVRKAVLQGAGMPALAGAAA